MELKAECNRPVVGLQLRLEVFSLFFLNLELKYIPKYCQITSLSPGYRAPILKIGPVRSQKPKINEGQYGYCLDVLREESAAVLT